MTLSERIDWCIENKCGIVSRADLLEMRVTLIESGTSIKYDEAVEIMSELEAAIAVLDMLNEHAALAAKITLQKALRRIELATKWDHPRLETEVNK